MVFMVHILFHEYTGWGLKVKAVAFTMKVMNHCREMITVCKVLRKGKCKLVFHHMLGAILVYL